jgi:hypothetical protein
MDHGQSAMVHFFAMIPMNLRKLLLPASFALVLAGARCAQTTPTITVSPSRVLHHDHVALRGSGFTASSNAYSHLRRPDGSEFPVLPIVTNERGEFEHDIDTLLLGPGTFEVSVEDGKSKATSNVARFEVTTDPKKTTNP